MFDLFIPDNCLDLIIRLTLAVFLGGIIGIERVISNHDAGLRTHILVCLGSAGIMVLSQLINAQYGGDIARMGAQVISGIGFLGAGCILVTGGHVKGLTTAAGLWATACVGLVTGSGYIFVSLVMTALMLFSMLMLRPLVSKLQNKHGFTRAKISITLNDRDDMLTITEMIYNHEINIRSVSFEDKNIAKIEVVCNRDEDMDRLLKELSSNVLVDKVTKI